MRVLPVSRTVDPLSARPVPNPARSRQSRPAIGVEPFDVAYGAGFQAADEWAHAVECEIFEDKGTFAAHAARTRTAWRPWTGPGAPRRTC